MLRAKSTLITHVKPTGPQCLQALKSLQVPHLSALLGLLAPARRQTHEEDTLSPLCEELKAQALGISAPDGLLPWATLQARQLQLPEPPERHGWAWLTLCHWQVNSDHVRMADPADCDISTDESQQVIDSMRAFMQEDGITLHGLHQGNWLASGVPFLGLPTASLARASGGAVDHWLPRQAQAQVLRRLQNEMQMLLYNHPVNDGRAARGLLPINSFWVSGTGSLPTDFRPLTTTDLFEELQEARRSDNAAAWTQAWQTLDNGPIKTLLEQARSGQPVSLTLCGENAAQTYDLQPQGLWARLKGRLGGNTVDLAALLNNL